MKNKNNKQTDAENACNPEYEPNSFLKGNDLRQDSPSNPHENTDLENEQFNSNIKDCKDIELRGKGKEGREGLCCHFQSKEKEKEEGLCFHFQDIEDQIPLLEDQGEKQYPILYVQRSIREKIENSHLPPELEGKSLNIAFYLISTINYAYWTNRDIYKNRKARVRLLAKFLKVVMGSSYNDWIKHLCSIEVIERGESYQVSTATTKGYAKGFRIVPSLANDSCDSITVKGLLNLPDRILKGFKAIQEDDMKSIGHDLVKENTLKLHIPNLSGAMLQLHYCRPQRPNESMEKYDSRIQEAIPSQKFIIDALSYRSNGFGETEYNACRISPVKLGRITTPFTNMCGELRSQVTLNGEYLTCIDIHASHWYHCVQKWEEKDSQEGKMLMDILTKQDFYEFLITLPEIPWTERDDLKEPSLAFIHAHPEMMSTDAKIVSKAIRGLAPRFWQWLNDQKAGRIKEESHKPFSHSVMREESTRVVVDTVGRLAQIDPKYPVVTVYDALYVPESMAPEALKVFTNVYTENYGTPPQFKVEKMRDIPIQFGTDQDPWNRLVKVA